MVMDLENIEKRVREIENALKLIAESMPMDNERIEHVFNEITGCFIDLYSYVQELDVIELSDNLDLLVLLIDALIECDSISKKQTFKSTLRTIEINDKYKGKSITVNLKVLDVRPNW